MLIIRSIKKPLSFVHLQTYVPTVFENYTACLELEDQRVELSLWDTSGKDEIIYFNYSKIAMSQKGPFFVNV